VNGVQADATVSLGEGVLTHRVQLGARVHFDEVTRVHTGDTYQLERMRMELQTRGLELERSHDQAWAVAGYASWGLTWRRLTITPGVRTELVWTKALDEFTGVEVRGEQLALLPGIGARLALLPKLAAFAGAHLGYSPVAWDQGGCSRDGVELRISALGLITDHARAAHVP
jgi:Fe(3+) dicitrate transport protein